MRTEEGGGGGGEKSKGILDATWDAFYCVCVLMSLSVCLCVCVCVTGLNGRLDKVEIVGAAHQTLPFGDCWSGWCFARCEW